MHSERRLGQCYQGADLIGKEALQHVEAPDTSLLFSPLQALAMTPQPMIGQHLAKAFHSSNARNPLQEGDHSKTQTK